MHFFSRRKSIVICFLLASHLLVAQDTPIKPQGKSRWGNYFLMDVAWNNQSNLDRVLKNNGLPETRVLQAGATLGWLYQLSRLELGLDASLFGRGTTDDEVEMQRRSVLVSFNAKYLLGNKVQWYPLVGVGFASDRNRITPENVATDINLALTSNRNTTTLDNQQGFAQLGLGLRLNGDSNYVFEGFEIGYRLGFATKPWSTRLGGSMTNSVTDELRQFYVRVVLGGFKRKRR